MTSLLTQLQRAAAQEWASKVQQLEAERSKLKIELSAAYGLIENYEIEIQRLKALLQLTFNDVIQTCNTVLKEIKK